MKLLVFTYAPAGLGHLRVTDALADSRPENFSYIMLGSHDKFISTVHRFFSTNIFGKWIFTSAQYGIAENIVTYLYRSILVHTNRKIYIQLKNLLVERDDVDEIWVVATHFGMAHQIGAIKDKLMKETGKKVNLIVQVTDDTSQHIWCIKGADLTFVPSIETKKKLEKYSNRFKMNLKFEVVPYPICPTFVKRLDEKVSRTHAFKSNSDKINVSVPISGAAVGLSYISRLISMVSSRSDRFTFWVIVKKSVYTEMFLNSLSKLPNVNLITGRNDNEMIYLYESLYKENLIHIEITKPSEQAFKAILPPSLVGGSILLFTTPVGRQEFENIDFLVRQGLIPRSNYGVDVNNDYSLCNYPRAIRLSNDPKIASEFILWALNSGLFSKMSSSFKFSKDSISSGSVGPDGANIFWKIVKKHFS